MKNNIYFVLTISFFTFYSCTSDSIYDLGGITETNVTYSSTVKAIVDNNCIQCHASTPVNGAPMSLTTYENVKDAVLNRGLLDRISRAEGTDGAMPFGGPRLPQTNIDAINNWANNNFPE